MATPSYTQNLNELYATTLRLVADETTNNIFEAVPLLKKLQAMGRVKSQVGGSVIEERLVYAKNTSAQSIGRGGTVDLVKEENFTNARYDWKYITGHIVRYYVDVQQNRGKAKIMDLVEGGVKALKDSMIDAVEEMLINGTATDSQNTLGLKQIVADTNTNTIGGLSSSDISEWANYSKNMTGLSAATNLLKQMNVAYNNISKYMGANQFPDLVICSQDVYEYLEDEVQDMTTVDLTTAKGEADLAYSSITYKKMPIVWSPKMDSQRLYMLNTSFLRLVIDPEDWMKLREWRPIENTPDDMVAHVIFPMEFVTSARNRHAVLHTIDTE